MYAPVRVGLIGLGRHGIRYARHLAGGDVEGARLVAAWRRDEAEGQRQCDELGARFEPSVRSLVDAPDVDALMIVVPAGEHEPLARSVAEAKKPLLLEKPMARTVAEAESIATAFEEAGAELTIAQTVRFDPLTRALATARTRFGRLTGFGFEQRLENRDLAWEDEPEVSGGGVLIQTGIHTIDALRVVTGSEVRVLNAALGSVYYEKNEDVGLLHLRADDALGDLRISKIGKSRHMRFALYFEDGGLEADYIDRVLYETRGRDRTGTPYPPRPTIPALLSEFVRFLRKERDNPVPPRDALESLRVVEQAYDLNR